jgi:hypothetical protein
MPTHQYRTTTTPDGSTAEQAPEQSSAENELLAALLSGAERVDGEARYYFERGITFQRGMKGDLIRRVQQAIGAGQDGDFGPTTERLLLAWQKRNGMDETGFVDYDVWKQVLAATRTLRNLSGEDDFDAMWEAHPRNNPYGGSKNVSTPELVRQLGLPEGSVPNTCALRMSTMLNRMGGDMTVTSNKGIQAGLHEMRAGGLYMPHVRDELQDGKAGRVILSAREFWVYLEKHRGKPDYEWPSRGRFTTPEAAEEGAKHVEDVASSKAGFVAFDKILTYSGTGHVDIFKGKELSAASSWYHSQKYKLWFVADLPQSVEDAVVAAGEGADTVALEPEDVIEIGAGTQ